MAAFRYSFQQWDGSVAHGARIGTPEGQPGGMLFIGATEALLGADAKGYRALGGNFYQRSEEPAVRGMVA